MKNILFIIYSYSLGGGAEKVLTSIVNHLDAQKYSIDILEYAQYNFHTEQSAPNVHLLEPIVSMQRDGKIKRLWKNIQVFSVSYFLKTRRKHYDLEISFNGQIPTFLLSGKTPAVAWIHGDIYDLKQRPYFRWLQRRALRRVSQIVAISENTRNSICFVYPEFANKTRLIYNGFDLEQIRLRSQIESEISIQQPAVAFVGRLDENKNPIVLLKAVKKLRSEGKTVYLYYLGQGELQKTLQAKITEEHLERQVFLLGYQTNPYPVVAKCGAVCMMSKSEGFPTVFAEGMALGVPFISTPVGGVTELSNGGACGVIVHNEEECAQALGRVLFDTTVHSRMKKNCLKHIERFSLKNQIAAIEQMIDCLTASEVGKCEK